MMRDFSVPEIQNVQTKAFIWMCLKYQIRRSNPPRLQWVTVDVVSKHDDSAGHCAGHNQTQTYLVDKQRPEFDRKIDRVRNNIPQSEIPSLLQTLDQEFKTYFI